MGLLKGFQISIIWCGLVISGFALNIMIALQKAYIIDTSKVLSGDGNMYLVGMTNEQILSGYRETSLHVFPMIFLYGLCVSLFMDGLIWILSKQSGDLLRQ